MRELSRPQTRTIHQLVGFVWVNIHATFFRLFGWLRVIVLYYRNLPFALTDTLLWGTYLLKNPYRISRAFLKSNLYGETPLPTLDKIARECQILSKDCVYELGCGTGRTCLWLRHFVRCRAVGIDHVPTYIDRANRIKHLLRLDHVNFICGDIFQESLREATIIYLYGTAMEDDWINKLLEHFKTLKAGTRIITTSYPLTDYSSDYKVLKSFKGWFPWGSTTIYLQEKLSSQSAQQPL